MYKWIYLFVSLGALISCTDATRDAFVEESSGPYIVVLNKTGVKNQALKSGEQVVSQSLVRQMMSDVGQPHKLKVQKLFHVAIRGGVYEMTPSQAKKIESDPRVAYVEKDEIITINAAQTRATWGLDRIDQTNLPLNGVYHYDENEASVNTYVIDTGVLISNNDFNGRAQHGYDAVENDYDATDCNGHGTHVAGTLGSTTYGVAKNVKIYGVRVLDCRGSGAYSNVIEGIEWVTANHVKPAVANMSLGGSPSKAIDDAVEASIQAGVTYVVAAGNSNISACRTSPSRVPSAITVGSTDRTDSRSSFSNYGECVDIYAPGSDISSLWISSNTSTKTISGTSMASPHVAGVVARYLAKNPEATPAQVTSALLAGSTAGKITQVGSGSPNLLLNTEFLGDQKNNDELKLINGEPITNLSGSQGEQINLSIIVPIGTASLSVKIDGGTGDADLYVKRAGVPTNSDYDCRPYKNGNTESCDWEEPTAGEYHVALVGYSSFRGVTLTVDFSQNKVGENVYTAQLQKTNESNEHKYTVKTGLQKLSLKGPSDADFDLYLYKKKSNGQLEHLKSSLSYNSEEEIDYRGEAGEYLAVVRSYSGKGEYELKITKP